MLGLKIGLLIPEFYYMRYYLRWVTHHLKCGILSVIWQSCVWSGLCIISFYMKLLVRDGAHAQINLKININVLKNGFPRWLSGKKKQKQKQKTHLPIRETWVRSLGWEDPLEKEMATHSSTLAWEIPWTEEPGGLQSTGL